MRWTSVVWSCCLLPVLAGCGTARHAVRSATQGVTGESDFLHARRGAEGARVAWKSVRGQHPQRVFSDEFRDGFVDGYADFLDRGEASQAPAVPPVPYARYQKYFGPDGYGLVRDYYLGFKYGGDVAVASGRRSLPAPPVESRPYGPAAHPGTPASIPVSPKPTDMIPPRVPDTGKFGEPKKRGSDDPPILLPPPPGEGRAIPPLPKPELPVIKPFNPDLSGAKFGPIPVPSTPERLPVPFPPLPVAEPLVEPLAVPSDEPKISIPPILDPLPLPVPALKVPMPTSARTPTVLDDLPVIPLPK